MAMRVRLSRCSAASSFLLQTDRSIQSLRYSASRKALYSELGGLSVSLCFRLFCLQLPPKKRPSPLQSISGCASSIRISQVVPDFWLPTTKNTGELAVAEAGRSSSPRDRASSLLSAAISASLSASCLRACLLVLERRAPVAASKAALAPLSISTVLRLRGVRAQPQPRAAPRATS